MDLHTHSTASDGILTPAELVSRAAEKGVTQLALTDHDTMVGFQEAKAEADRRNIELILGIEFSSQWKGRGIHIVGLNMDLESPVLQQAVASQEQRRLDRAVVIAERLENKGFKGAYEGAQAQAGGSAEKPVMLGRPHFARWMLEEGHVTTIQQAFKKWLGAGKPGDVKQVWPEVAEVVSWINQSGGVAVLAHPDHYKMTRTKLKAFLDDFVEAGGGAIEVCSGPQLPNVTRNMAQLCQEYGLLASCGSDFHSPGQAWLELGCYPQLPEGLTPVWQHFGRGKTVEVAEVFDTVG